MATATERTRSAFFYGTLMAPQVLHRVCHGSSNPANPIFANHNLKTTPSILHDYRRHRVKGADYPAISQHRGSTVRGTYVTGLTDADIWRLDIFEGEEYVREKVKVRVLLDEGGEGEEQLEAETYVWVADPGDLEEAEWDFATFEKEKMRFWVGAEGEGEYAEVDEAVSAQQQDGTRGRGANGHITNALMEEQKKDEVLKNAV